jgi:two-component system osmolarity sensor histidine kinase EnvZ
VAELSVVGTLGGLAERLKSAMPRNLFARALIIIVAPVLILQAILAYVFIDRHWDVMTRRLCRGVAGDVSAIIEVLDTHPGGDNSRVISLARRHMQLEVEFRPGERLPAEGAQRFPMLDRVLSEELSAHVGYPFRVDSESYPGAVDMYFALDGGVLRVLAPLSRMTSHTGQLFFVWMVGASIVLLTVAVMFLRNQIRPILRLTAAAEAFGKGQDADDFRPAGATEVRRAAHAFLAMRERIRRHVNQRTEMLAAVSHDLRTPLTRLKLRLAMMQEDDDTTAANEDVAEMEAMIEGFLAFARGAQAESAAPMDIGALIDEVAEAARERGAKVETAQSGELGLTARRQALKRCLTNLVENARRHAGHIRIEASRGPRVISVTVDDDGPGIPAAQREMAFRPFVRLDSGRNLDKGGVGLGLAIARDVVRLHGGEIRLEDSPMGGLRVAFWLPA